MAVLCAETWVGEALARRSVDHSCGNLVANGFYEQAIQKYRTVERAFREQHNVDSRILELREELRKSGEASLSEMVSVSSGPIDISEMVEDAVRHVEGKTLPAAILALADVGSGIRAEKIREWAKKLISDFKFSSMMSRTRYGTDGRVVAKSVGAPIDGDADGPALWAKSIEQYVFHVNLLAVGAIYPALERVRLEHRPNREDFIALARRSPLVPPGRHELVGKALYAGYDDEFDIALHLLVPQIEHFVRHRLREAGLTTTVMDRDGIENEVGLSSLMDKEEVESVLTEDLAFEIKALFCDAHGPNLRNELAHGLLGDGAAQSPIYIYAWCFLLKLVCLAFRRPDTPAGGDSTANSAADAVSEQA